MSFILQGGILIIQEKQFYTQLIQNSEGGVKGQFINKSKHQASSKCSLYSSYKHTACTCTQCYNNNQ